MVSKEWHDTSIILVTIFVFVLEVAVQNFSRRRDGLLKIGLFLGRIFLGKCIGPHLLLLLFGVLIFRQWWLHYDRLGFDLDLLLATSFAVGVVVYIRLLCRFLATFLRLYLGVFFRLFAFFCLLVVGCLDLDFQFFHLIFGRLLDRRLFWLRLDILRSSAFGCLLLDRLLLDKIILIIEVEFAFFLAFGRLLGRCLLLRTAEHTCILLTAAAAGCGRCLVIAFAYCCFQIFSLFRFARCRF